MTKTQSYRGKAREGELIQRAFYGPGQSGGASKHSNEDSIQIWGREGSLIQVTSVKMGAPPKEVISEKKNIATKKIEKKRIGYFRRRKSLHSKEMLEARVTECKRKTNQTSSRWTMGDLRKICIGCERGENEKKPTRVEFGS